MIVNFIFSKWKKVEKALSKLNNHHLIYSNKKLHSSK